MSGLKRKTAKGFLALMVLAVAVIGFTQMKMADKSEITSQMQASAAKTESKFETVKTSADTVLVSSREGLNKVHNRLNTVSDAVESLQHKALPMGSKIKSFVNPSDIPGMRSVKWATRNMSLPAIVFIMLFGGGIVVMGVSYAQSYRQI